MKSIKVFVFSLVSILTCFINTSTAQWIKISNGIGDQNIYSLASSGNNIIAGSYGGGFLSTDNGNSWTNKLILPNHYIWSLAVNGNTVFGGSDNDLGLYISSDFGSNWIHSSLDSHVVYSLVSSGNNIFAGTDRNNIGTGVYFSGNNGVSWNQTTLNNKSVRSLAVNGNKIFAGTSFSTTDYGVFLSTDNGASWNITSLSGQTVYSLVFNGNRLFAGTIGNAVYYSDDNGSTWTQTFVPGQSVYSIAVSGNNIFAGTYQSGVYQSANNGSNWSNANTGFPNGISVYSMCIFNNYIYAGTLGQGVWRRPLSEVVGIHPTSTEVPENFSLSQNYPNPFNPSTKLGFGISDLGYVSLKIYDVHGREVAVLVNENLSPGSYEFEWNASGFPSGVYFYKLQSGQFSETKKMLLTK